MYSYKNTNKTKHKNHYIPNRFKNNRNSIYFNTRFNFSIKCIEFKCFKS